MSKRKTKGPLLFINQTYKRPSFNNNMQEVYTIKPEIEDAVEEIKAGSEKKINAASKAGSFREPIPIEINKMNIRPAVEDTETETKPKASINSTLKRVKPFNEMDIRERIDYLLNIPKVLPPVPCVFYTTNQNYQGYLLNHDENQVTIQFHNKTTKTISVDEIKNIIMIGLKR
ncbi:CotO family spore coat protein [Neobacillus mesonae]|nr:CotO family spore coat protein [Neobacillus mesonae]